MNNPPDEQLLLACAASGVDRNRPPEIEDLVRQVTHWNRLIRLAQRHRLTPFLFRVLSKDLSNQVPPAALDRLREIAVANTIRNAFLIKELPRTLDLFKANQVRAIPLKGPVMTFSLYGDPNLRQIDDLDFLVHPDDLARAKELLVAAGYDPFPRLTHAEEKAYARIGSSHCMRSPDGQYYLDLETQIAPRQFSFNMPLDLLWADLEELNMDGHTYKTLSIENLALILCVHGTKHLWERLIWTVDIATLLRKRGDLSFDRLFETAIRCGGMRMLLVGLQMAREVTGEALPAEADEAVRQDPIAGQLAHAAVLWIMGDPASSPSLRQEVAFHFAIRERLRDRLRCGLLNLLMPTYSDWKSFSLPERLFPLYYATRPFRLFKKLVLKRRG